MALYRISELSHETEDMAEFFAQIHRIVAEFIYAENFYVALYDRDAGTLSFPYFVDLEDKFTTEQLTNIPVKQFDKTLTGHMLRTGEHLHIDKKTMQQMNNDNIINVQGKYSHEWLGIPLKKGKHVLGAVVAQTYDENYGYTPADIDLLRFISRQLAIVLLRKQNEDLLKQQHAQLEKHVYSRTKELAEANRELQIEVAERTRTEQLMRALYRITMVSAEAENLDEFYTLLHNILGGLLNTPNMYVAVLDKSTQEFTYPYYSNEYYSSPEQQPFLIQQIEQEHIESVFNAQTTLRFSHDEKRPHNRDRNPMFSSWLGLPLKDEMQASIGVLVIIRYNVEDDFSNDERNLLNYVAQQISASIQRQHQQTALIQAHNELQSINNLLEERVAERTRELSETNEHLQDVIKERLKIEEKLAHDAFHDSLTQLPNRALFIDRLEKAIENRQRNKKDKFAVLFLDLDRFKVINDSLGHYIGDMLLIDIANKLTQCVRPGDTVSRLGGDEFAILLIDHNNHQAAQSVAQRIAKSLSEPIELKGTMTFTSSSIGINLCDNKNTNASEILRDADTAMYEAKSRGKAQTAIFNSTMYDRAVKTLKIESELRRALDKDQIQVFYQPIIALETDEIIAFEALARWHHPKMGWISPVDFIPIAEETGLISDIGLYILDAAIQQTQEWHKTHPYYSELMISVNLSSYQLAQNDLYQDSMQIIEHHHFPKNLLRLEVTESLLIDNFDTAREILNRYAEDGIKILLDDFGTGYSSLSYLHQFPIHALKVDRSFVNDMDKSNDNLVIISTIKKLAESLNMEVIAEGIEMEHQQQTLKKIGFEYGQGYYFAKPMPAGEVNLFLTQKAK